MGDRRTPWLGRPENEPQPKKKKKKKPVDTRHARYHRYKDFESKKPDKDDEGSMRENRRRLKAELAKKKNEKRSGK